MLEKQYKLLKFMILLSLFLAFFSSVSAIDVANCTDLQNIESNLSGTYYLTADINCSDTINWNNGSGFEPISNFSGTFQGEGYKIYDLFINKTYSNSVGLFDTFSGATINNTYFIRPRIYAQDYVGVLAGSVGHSGDLSQSWNYIYNTTVEDGLISARDGVGGIVGHDYKAHIYNSFFFGSVSGRDEIGGIVGWMKSNGASMDLYYNYVDGNVSGSAQIGGIVGQTDDGLSGLDNVGVDIRFSSVNGRVVGTNVVGGIAGSFFHRSAYDSGGSWIRDSVVHADVIMNDVNIVGGIAGYCRSTSSSQSHAYLQYGFFTGNLTYGSVANTGAVVGRNLYCDPSSTDLRWDSNNTNVSVCTGIGNQLNDCSGDTTENLFQSINYPAGFNFITTWKIYENITYAFLRDLPEELQFINNTLYINFTYPLNNSQGNHVPNITFVAESNSAETMSCSLYVDSALNQTNSSVRNNIETMFSLPSLNDGAHTFYIQCNDGAVAETTGVYNFYYDGDEPQIYSISPLPFNTTTFNGYLMNFFGNVTNFDLTNVTRIITRPNGTVFYYNETTSFGDPTLYSWNETFNTTPDDNGVWSYYIYAGDQIPNVNEQHISFTVNNCVPSWSCNSFTLCNSSDQQLCDGVTDINNCSYPYSGDYSEFGVLECNYCDSDIQILNETNCYNQIKNVWYVDNNFATCCNVTKNGTDCYGGVVQNSSLYYESGVKCSPFSYEESDIPLAIISVIAKIVIVLGIFAFIITFAFISSYFKLEK